jgi:hypothetical protein
LSIIDENKLKISNLGGLSPLLLLLSSINSRIQEQAAGAVRNLSVNPECKVTIVNEGGLPPLIALLRSPVETIQEQAAVAVRNISVNADYRLNIVQNGALPSLVMLIRCDNEGIQEHASVVLRQLAKGLLLKQWLTDDRIDTLGLGGLFRLLQSQFAVLQTKVLVMNLRNRPWLEARINEGAQDEALHNALAKIYIDTAQNPEKFLKENRFYNSLVVGKYCETRYPHYSVIAYTRGGCDDELIAVTSAHGLHKDQAMYLIQRKDQELWAKVLRSEDVEARQRVVDQVVQVGLPESRNADEVSETVKAFMSADMPSALIAPLEKIVLHQGSEFGQNKNLQNLLIITAIRADATRVMGYINRLDKFDATAIAELCVANLLFGEAVVIYRRNNMIDQLANLKDIIKQVSHDLGSEKDENAADQVSAELERTNGKLDNATAKCEELGNTVKGLTGQLSQLQKELDDTAQAERALAKQLQQKELLAMGLDPEKVYPRCVTIYISYITHVSGTPAPDER